MNSNGNLTFVDPILNKGYALHLAKKCSRGASGIVNIDPKTPLYFDQEYYNNLRVHKGLFHTDSILFADQRTKNLVEILSSDINRFVNGWTQSFVKLSGVGVKTGNQGEIRQFCSRVNG